MRLRDIMTVGIRTIGPDETASAARTKMKRHRIRHLVVVDGGRVIGIVSERDLGRGGSRVREVMTADVVSATPDTTLRQAANLMRGRSIGSLLVVDDGELVGLVTPTGPRGGRRARKTPAQRYSLPTTLPRPLKLARDRSHAVPPPAHVRVIGAEIDDQLRENITRKLGRKLGKFSSSIERITVRLSDANGPRGGRDQVCQIKVVLSGLPSVVVEERDSAIQRAIDRAMNGAALAVRRSVQRRRLKPLRRDSSRA
jgi:ribosome-associated translation inhibitor RaiA